MNENTKVWGIVGLGWLGLELSIEIYKRGHITWGTHRSNFNFETDAFPADACNVLLLNTPPLLKMKPEIFAQKIFADPECQILFISSTSVYGGNSGRVNEGDKALPASKSAMWLLEVEGLLRDRFGDRLTVVRPGGLIGDKRHPIFSLSGKTEISGRSNPVNLIHRADLIEILIAITSGQMEMSVLNAVAPHHPRKDTYYMEWAERLHLPAPEFAAQDDTHDRIVESRWLEQLHPNWKCPRLDFI